ITPFQAFPTKDNWIVIGMGGGTNRWPLFCALIDRVALMDDERFQTGFSRTQHVEELEPLISEALKRKTTAEWMVEFEGIGLPCAPINTIDQAAADPQIAAREMIVDIPAGNGRQMRLVNTPIKMSRTVCSIEQGAPDLGEHTREVIALLLGLSDEEIDALEVEEII
ncbi:MAG: CoA transferase, partial [Dehalococcoidia bacterium]|nr:CoA transferase [Dehalococcoidia bacterium]